MRIAGPMPCRCQSSSSAGDREFAGELLCDRACSAGRRAPNTGAPEYLAEGLAVKEPAFSRRQHALGLSGEGRIS
jgi:hypothetical protein